MAGDLAAHLRELGAARTPSGTWVVDGAQFALESAFGGNVGDVVLHVDGPYTVRFDAPGELAALGAVDVSDIATKAAFVARVRELHQALSERRQGSIACLKRCGFVPVFDPAWPLGSGTIRVDGHVVRVGVNPDGSLDALELDGRFIPSVYAVSFVDFERQHKDDILDGLAEMVIRIMDENLLDGFDEPSERTMPANGLKFGTRADGSKDSLPAASRQRTGSSPAHLPSEDGDMVRGKTLPWTTGDILTAHVPGHSEVTEAPELPRSVSMPTGERTGRVVVSMTGEYEPSASSESFSDWSGDATVAYTPSQASRAPADGASGDDDELPDGPTMGHATGESISSAFGSADAFEDPDLPPATLGFGGHTDEVGVSNLSGAFDEMGRPTVELDGYAVEAIRREYRQIASGGAHGSLDPSRTTGDIDDSQLPTARDIVLPRRRERSPAAAAGEGEAAASPAPREVAPFLVLEGETEIASGDLATAPAPDFSNERPLRLALDDSGGDLTGTATRPDKAGRRRMLAREPETGTVEVDLEMGDPSELEIAAGEADAFDDIEGTGSDAELMRDMAELSSEEEPLSADGAGADDGGAGENGGEPPAEQAGFYEPTGERSQLQSTVLPGPAVMTDHGGPRFTPPVDSTVGRLGNLVGSGLSSGNTGMMRLDADMFDGSPADRETAAQRLEDEALRLEVRARELRRQATAIRARSPDVSDGVSIAAVPARQRTDLKPISADDSLPSATNHAMLLSEGARSETTGTDPEDHEARAVSGAANTVAREPPSFSDGVALEEVRALLAEDLAATQLVEQGMVFSNVVDEGGDVFGDFDPSPMTDAVDLSSDDNVATEVKPSPLDIGSSPLFEETSDRFRAAIVPALRRLGPVGLVVADDKARERLAQHLSGHYELVPMRDLTDSDPEALCALEALVLVRPTHDIPLMAKLEAIGRLASKPPILVLSSDERFDRIAAVDLRLDLARQAGQVARQIISNLGRLGLEHPLA